MGESRADTAAIEVHYMALLTAGEDHAPAKGVSALMADQPRLQQHIEGIAQVGQMTPQISARSIADAQFLNQFEIMQTSLLQILNRLGMTVEFELVKGGSFLE